MPAAVLELPVEKIQFLGLFGLHAGIELGGNAGDVAGEIGLDAAPAPGLAASDPAQVGALFLLVLLFALLRRFGTCRFTVPVRFDTSPPTRWRLISFTPAGMSD